MSVLENKKKELESMNRNELIELICQLELEIKLLNTENARLNRERVKLFNSDTCQKCGCNEFLCGHNKRG